MNLVLVEPHELDAGRATLRGRRARHIALVHRAEAGRTLRAGIVGGKVGTATVVRADENEAVLQIDAGEEPPPPLACTLVLALPRPKVLRRTLAAAAAFGIKRIVLIAAARVEKSYWQSPLVADDAIRAELLLGLEQAGDTIVPTVEKRRLFRPFVEDELATIASGSLALVADPHGELPCPAAGSLPVTLVVGPEGGFVAFELALLRSAGLTCVTLGVRPLRVEFALAALLGRLF